MPDNFLMNYGWGSYYEIKGVVLPVPLSLQDRVRSSTLHHMKVIMALTLSKLGCRPPKYVM
jgi:hypothetical protein